jgi:hypothetical protein
MTLLLLMVDPGNQSGHCQYDESNTNKFVDMEEIESKNTKDRRQAIEHITDLPGI